MDHFWSAERTPAATERTLQSRHRKSVTKCEGSPASRRTDREIAPCENVADGETQPQSQLLVAGCPSEGQATLGVIVQVWMLGI